MAMYTISVIPQIDFIHGCDVWQGYITIHTSAISAGYCVR